MARRAGTCSGGQKWNAPRWMVMASFAILALLALALAYQFLVRPMTAGARGAEGFDEPKAVLVFLHMHGCGWCEKFKPHWSAFRDKYRGGLAKAGVKLEEVEASEPEAKRYRKFVEGYPTVLLFVGQAAEPVRFEGERTPEGLLGFLGDNGYAVESFYVERVSTAVMQDTMNRVGRDMDRGSDGYDSTRRNLSRTSGMKMP